MLYDIIALIIVNIGCIIFAERSAGVAELADAYGLGPYREIYGGSSPSARTTMRP